MAAPALTPEEEAALLRAKADPRRRLAGRYLLLRELGSGAYGSVHAAWDEVLERPVAVKLLAREEARARERFRREGAALARLRHPGIVSVHDVGETATGVPYLVMDLVRGRSLLAASAGGLLPPAEAAGVVREVALAMQHAHEQGVLHRDLKPHNILLQDDGRPIVVDFGLVRFEDGTVDSMTGDGTMLGTPAYMPPEQVGGPRRAVDARSDVYALGATLYHALTGAPPFTGNRAQITLATLREVPAPPSGKARNIPATLDAVCLRCLEKDPAARFQSARALAEALAAAMPPAHREPVEPDPRSTGRAHARDVARGPALDEEVTAVPWGQRTWLAYRGTHSKGRGSAETGASLDARPTVSRTCALVVGGLLLVVVTSCLIGSLTAQTRRVAGYTRDAGASEAADEAVPLARAKLVEAERLLGDTLRALAAAGQELARARKERDEPGLDLPAVERRARRAAAAGMVTEALRHLEEAEDALFDATDAPGLVALVRLREVLAVAPPGHEVFDRARGLTRELVRALRTRAERRGDSTQAAVCAHELQALRGEREGPPTKPQLVVETDPAGAAVSLQPVLQEAGGWRAGQVTYMGQTPLERGAEVAPGEHLLTLDAPGRVTIRVPLVVDDGERVVVRLALPRVETAPAGFVWVPPGETPVGGDPRAVRPLARDRTLVWTDGFFLSKTEVTVDEYVAFLAGLPAGERTAHLSSPLQLDLASDGVAARPGTARHPVVGVGLESARRYCGWRSLKERGRRYRLPTDVEWEKAGRGPAGRVFPWGDTFAPGALAQLHLGDDAGRPRLAPTQAHLVDCSIYGVFDLAGNVSEWVEGHFDGDPRFGVLRGGSWARGPEVVRLASREPIDSSDTADFLRVRDRVGFRLALDVE